MHLYIYYDVPHAAVAATMRRVLAMQAELAVECGFEPARESAAARPRLMRRDPLATGAQTWMEVYPDVTAEFESRLAARVAAHGLATLAGPRHIERFVDLASAPPPCA